MSTALRPLNTGELLDRTFSLYRSHYALFLGIAALPHLVLLAFQLMGLAIHPRTPGLSNVIYSIVWGLFILLVSIVVSAVSQAATIVAVSNVYLDRPAGVLDSFARLGSKIIGVVLLSALMFFAVLLGFMFFLVPGILLTIRWSLAVPAKVLEGIGIGDSLSRSSQLTEGNRWRIFVIWLLVIVLIFAVGALLQWPVLFGGLFLTKNMSPSAQVWVLVATQVTGFISQTLVGPLLAIAFSLVYYDQRVRKEAFDLQLMMTTLDGQQQFQPAPA
jgi:hypothetical protein